MHSSRKPMNFSKFNHTVNLVVKSSLIKYNTIKITSCNLSDCTTMELKINKSNYRNNSHIWRLKMHL